MYVILITDYFMSPGSLLHYRLSMCSLNSLAGTTPCALVSGNCTPNSLISRQLIFHLRCLLYFSSVISQFSFYSAVLIWASLFLIGFYVFIFPWANWFSLGFFVLRKRGVSFSGICVYVYLINFAVFIARFFISYIIYILMLRFILILPQQST